MPDQDIPSSNLPNEEIGQERPEDSDFPKTCQWTNQRQALMHFASYEGATQSQQHIKPLHWYVACRLVIEGGFRPEEITPRPPFSLKKQKGKWQLAYDPALAAGGEATVLGESKPRTSM